MNLSSFILLFQLFSVLLNVSNLFFNFNTSWITFILNILFILFGLLLFYRFVGNLKDFSYRLIQSILVQQSIVWSLSRLAYLVASKGREQIITLLFNFNISRLFSCGCLAESLATGQLFELVFEISRYRELDESLDAESLWEPITKIATTFFFCPWDS